MPMPAKTVIWGLGNELLGDDAVGLEIIRRLAKTAPATWALIECGTVPENYLSTIPKKIGGRLIVIDAADMGINAGDIRLATLEDADDVNFATHGLPLPLLLGPHAASTEIILIGIQPLDLRPGKGLTPAVERAVDAVAKAILEGSWRQFPRLHQEKRSPR
jgi:hydrogenase 3 maturation protease